MEMSEKAKEALRNAMADKELANEVIAVIEELQAKVQALEEAP